jgi:hypothetical protein
MNRRAVDPPTAATLGEPGTPSGMPPSPVHPLRIYH